MTAKKHGTKKETKAEEATEEHKAEKTEEDEPANKKVSQGKKMEEDSSAESFVTDTVKNLVFRRQKRLWCSFLFLALIVYFLSAQSPCSKAAGKKRRDCGFPGITTTECVTTQVFYRARGLESFAQVFGVFGAAGLTIWYISGYEVGSIMWYLFFSASASFWVNRCCHDDAVGDGVPHCYKPNKVVWR